MEYRDMTKHKALHPAPPPIYASSYLPTPVPPYTRTSLRTSSSPRPSSASPHSSPLLAPPPSPWSPAPLLLPHFFNYYLRPQPKLFYSSPCVISLFLSVSCIVSCIAMWSCFYFTTSSMKGVFFCVCVCVCVSKLLLSFFQIVLFLSYF